MTDSNVINSFPIPAGTTATLSPDFKMEVNIDPDVLSKIIRFNLSSYLYQTVNSDFIDEITPKIVESIQFLFKNKSDK
jgi:hypothetical protein